VEFYKDYITLTPNIQSSDFPDKNLDVEQSAWRTVAKTADLFPNAHYRLPNNRYAYLVVQSTAFPNLVAETDVKISTNPSGTY
jgi:hypothetical protein